MKLITGGCGFIGSNAAAHYLAKGEKVIVIDNLYRFGAANNLAWLQGLAKKSKASFIFCHQDIRDREGLFDLFKHYSFQMVMHFAGQVAATTSIENPILDFDVNTIGTFNVCEAVRRNSPEAQLVFTSTNKVYGDLRDVPLVEKKLRFMVDNKSNGLDEKTPLDFHSPYGCSKGAADQYVRDFSRIYNLSTVVLRLSTVYGGRQFATYDQGWIGWFAKEILNNRDFTMTGNGKQVRDILHIEDFLRLLDCLAERKSKIGGEIFNIGGGPNNSLSLLEFVNILFSKTGNRPSYHFIEERQGDQRWYVSDVRKAQKLVGWFPLISKEEGIQQMLSWIKHLD